MIDYGHGVSLDTIEPEHLSEARCWRNSPAIWASCRQNSLISSANHHKWHEKINSDSSIQMFSIKEGETGKFVGVCGFTSIDMLCRRAEFSLYIAPKLHRNGYAKNALKTLFQHGFMDWGFNCIWGETIEGNPALELFLKIGMKKEGLRRQFYFKKGKFIDAHLVSILRSEWAA